MGVNAILLSSGGLTVVRRRNIAPTVLRCLPYDAASMNRTASNSALANERGQDAHAPSRTLPIMALLTGALAVGFAPIFAEIAMDSGGIGPSAAGFWRVWLSVPVLALFWLVPHQRPGSRHATRSRHAPEHLRLRHYVLLLIPGALFGGDLAVWHSSFEYTTLAAATLLANCQVILVGLFGWLVLRESMSWKYPVGAALAMGGVAMLLLTAPDVSLEGGANPLIGNLLALLTAVFYASYILSVQYVRRFHSTATVVIATSALSGVVLLAVSYVSGETIATGRLSMWLAVIGLAIVPHCMGQGLITFSLAKLPAGFTAVTLLLQPPGVALWAWIILGETLTGPQMAAGVIVLIGIYLARRGTL